VVVAVMMRMKDIVVRVIDDEAVSQVKSDKQNEE